MQTKRNTNRRHPQEIKAKKHKNEESRENKRRKSLTEKDRENETAKPWSINLDNRQYVEV